jgi:hypothetical protein
MGRGRLTHWLAVTLARFGRPGRIGLWLIAVGGAVYLALGFAELLGVPDRRTWDADASVARSLLLLVAISLIGSASARLRVLENRVSDQRRAMDRERALRVVEDGCRFMLSEVHQRTKLSPLELGVSIWRAGDGQLVRVGKFRLASRQGSGVVWTKGKGAIGRCWLDNDRVVADLTRLHELDVTEATFDALPDATRLGMPWIDFQRTAAYTAVWAEPLRDRDGRWMGCLSVDSEAPGAAQLLRRRVVRNASVLSLVETLAINLAALLGSGG